jgi:membrane protease YdiL (CAAX protease family)
MQVLANGMEVAGKNRWSSIVGLLLSLGVVSLPIGSWINSTADSTHGVVFELIIWGSVVATLLYVARVEKRPLSSVGFRVPGVKDGIIAILAGICILASLAAVYYVIFPALHWNEDQQIATVSAIPYWLQALIVVRAAVSEELFFRGYAIERLQEMSGSRAVPAIVSCTIFTLDHVSFWGWHHIVVAGTAGILLTLLYLWRRNLWVNMVAHFIVDAAAFLL